MLTGALDVYINGTGSVIPREGVNDFLTGKSWL